MVEIKRRFPDFRLADIVTRENIVNIWIFSVAEILIKHWCLYNKCHFSYCVSLTKSVSRTKQY